MDEVNADLIAQFMGIADCNAQKAESYLRVSDFDLATALQLFFETGGADMEAPAASTPSPPPTRHSRGTSNEPVEINDDDDDDDLREAIRASAGQTSSPGNASLEDDEAMARRLQEEFYGSGGAAGAAGDGVRAPIARTRETLVGPEDDNDYDFPVELNSGFRRAHGGPASIFNQRTTVWGDRDPSSMSVEERRHHLVEATGGAAARDTQAGKLADLFRPPIEIISHLSFGDARDEAKDLEKWILVNVQDQAVFTCQVLNRDIWKAGEVQQTVRENFIFLQMDRNGRDGRDFIRLYLPEVASGMANDAFPHLAIIDPRTGEQVKVWTEMPTTPLEFVHSLHEFLDRYSLRVDAKNPVQRTAIPKKINVDRMTEDEMLQLAVQNSLGEGGSNSPRSHDPDELTKVDTDLMDFDDANSVSKGKEVEQSPFQRISSQKHHEEPSEELPATRIRFKLHDGTQVVRKFLLSDRVERLFEYVKADLLPEHEAKKGGGSDKEFELVNLGKKLIEVLDQTVEEAGLKMGVVMVETMED